MGMTITDVARCWLRDRALADRLMAEGWGALAIAAYDAAQIARAEILARLAALVSA